MKKIIITILLLIVAHIAKCQNSLWGASPQRISTAAIKLGLKFESQDTDKNNTLFLYYSVADGFVAVYIFEKQALVAIINSYDTTKYQPKTPDGVEKNVDGKTVWFNYAEDAKTSRSYDHQTIVDGISPIQ